MNQTRVQSRFRPLLNVRKSQLDLRRQILKQLICDEDELNERLQGLLRERMAVLGELRDSGKLGKVNLAASRVRYQRACYLQQASKPLQRRLELLRSQSKLCLQKVLDLSQAVKVIEKLLQNRQTQWLAAQSKRDWANVQERLATDAYLRSSG